MVVAPRDEQVEHDRHVEPDEARGQKQRLAHDRLVLVRVPVGPAVDRAADRPLEEAVAGEAVGAVDEERVVDRRVPGGRDRADLERPRMDRLVVEARDHRNAEPRRELVGADDVVRMPMSHEHVRDLDPSLVDEREERLLDAVRVDQDAVAAVGDKVRVGRPARMLGALNQQSGSRS